MTRRYNSRNHDAHPPHFTQGYKSSITRSPQHKLIRLEGAVGEVTGPVFGHSDIESNDNNLLVNYATAGEGPIGERIILHGHVLDEHARPVPNTLVEIWQANAGGRYRHKNDSYLAPIDPNFGGCGRTVTDENGRYSFQTVKPGAYPWQNHENSWRPAHIHVSVFGWAFCQRLITQCYFEGDPLIPICPIVQTIPDPDAIDRLIARLDLDATIPFDSVAYRFDVVLRGQISTPFENRAEGN